MPSESELLNDINRIANVIQQHRLAQQHQQRPPPAQQQYRPLLRPGYPTRPYNAPRGRGRGNLTLRPSTQRHGSSPESFNKSTYRSNPTHNKSLVLNNPSSYVAPRPFLNKTLNNTSTTVTTPSSPVIQRKLPGPHRSLVINNSNNTSASSSPKVVLARPGQHKKLVIRHTPGSTKSDRIKRYQNSSGQKVVEIDGVPFINMGKKLVRQDLHGQAQSSTPRVLIRRLVKRRDINQNLVLGKRRRMENAVYRREPEGYERQGAQGKTLVRKTSTTKTRRLGNKKPTYCGTFTRYGTCPKRTLCSFIHDPKHVAICLRYLVSKECPLGPRCPLSHDPTPHNTPHCRHFQRIKCSNEACPFAHVRIRPDAPLCRTFAVEGYCPKGLACKNLHIIVCPNFAVLGKCTKRGCRLPHVSPSGSLKQKTPVPSHQKPLPGTSTEKTLPETTYKTNKVIYGQQQWVRPGLKDAIDRQRQAKGTQANPSHEESRAEDDGNTEVEHEDGFVPLFGDDEEVDDADWNQYVIKNPEDIEEIKSLRFSDETEAGDDDDEADDDDNNDDGTSDHDGDNDPQENGAVYEEVSDDGMDYDDDSVEEIYEEASDMEDE